MEPAIKYGQSNRDIKLIDCLNSLDGSLKGRFHDATNLLKNTNDQILLVSGMDRPVPTDQFEKGAALADGQTCYFIIGRQDKLSFGAKTTVQCSNQLKHKINWSSVFFSKIFDTLILLVSQSEDCLVVHTSRSDRPNKSISIGLSSTGH